MNDNILKEEIGHRIKQVRLDLGFNQAQFARKMKIVQTTLSKYERGETTPDCLFLSRIYYDYGVDIQELVIGTKAEKQHNPSKDLLDEGILMQVVDMSVQAKWIKLLTKSLPTYIKEFTETYEFLYWKKHKK